MKKFLLILLTIIIVLAGGICGLYLNLESIVKASVAKYGSQLTGTDDKLIVYCRTGVRSKQASDKLGQGGAAEHAAQAVCRLLKE